MRIMYLCGSMCMGDFNTYTTQVFLSLATFFSPFLPHPLSLSSSFIVSQNILFLSMEEFRADKGVEGSGGSDIMGFSCQIGSKSSLWASRRAKGGSRFLPDFCGGNDWGPARPHQQPAIHWWLWYWLTVQGVTVGKVQTHWECFINQYFSIFQIINSCDTYEIL